MAKSSDVTKVQPDLRLPAHLKDKEVKGVEQLADYVRPPLLKIIQKSADDVFLEKFNLGDLIMLPSQTVIAVHGDSFKFVPLFFYSEACTWTPIEKRGQMPAILDRSTVKTSQLYQKASNRDLWEEEIQWEGHTVKVQHVEHLVFIVTLYDHPLQGEPMIMSFAKGEFGTGCKFASLVKIRKASPFACVFQCKVSDEPRKNNKGSWYGLDITNPDIDTPPWVSEEQLPALEAIHDDLATSFKKGLIRADHDAVDEPTDEMAVPAGTEDEI